ncbi:MAG TPA: hypothetical protein VF744_18360 [Beijerinckiaceae bacterium]|jgi:hypothetical protein
MITALVLTDGRLEPLAATLAALVPGVAEGLVADAVVLSGADAAAVAAVADGVGASHVRIDPGAGGWAAGAAAARRDWLLCLEAGDVPQDGWIGEVESFLAEAAGPGLGRARRDALLARLSLVPERLLGTGEVRPGDLVHRSLLTGPGLSRRVRPARLGVRIRTRR